MAEYTKVIPVNDIDELFEHLNPRNPLWSDRMWIFRGHGDMNWPLLPSAYRDSWYPRRVAARDGRKTTVLSQAGAEWHWLQLFLEQVNESGLRLASGNESVLSLSAGIGHIGQFMEYYASKLKDPRVWPPKELLPNIALAQHHGIATRLLDWTKSAYTAVYFAAAKAAAFFKGVETKPDDWSHFSIWALNRRHLVIFEIMQKAFACLVTLPRSSNGNLHAQSGLFLYYWDNEPVDPGVEFKPKTFDEIASEALAKVVPTIAPNDLATGALSEAGLIRFDVPGHLAGPVLKELRLFGASATHLFPGYDGAAKAVLDAELW
jgi:hypothetical protein